jgi:CubicO group peptidase (beta-lactamase class C family)
MKKLIGIIIAGSIAALLGLCIYHRCFSMIPPVDIVTQLDNYITSWVKQDKFSGSVLVAQKGKILLCKGYGMANYEHMAPNTPHTKFDLGSITKQFTSMAIMQLVQAGKLKLSDTVASIVPDAPHGKEITVYQLLTHTAGIPDHEESVELDYSKPATALDFDYSKHVSIADIIKWLKNKPLEFTPESKFKYSNTGYVLLAAIIEKTSGKDYETFIQEHIFKPLGMNNSGMLDNKKIILNRAQGYHRTGTDLQNAHYYDPSVDIASGALYSTIEDMYLWDRALYTDKLLSSVLRKQLWQPHLDEYGLGWRATSIHEHRCVMHTGGWFDCATIIMRFIDDDICIIVLSNFDAVSAPVKRIADDLAAIVFGLHYALPRTAIKIDTSLYDLYVGRYEIKPDLIVTVAKKSNQLFVQTNDQSADEIFPESETEFFMNTTDGQISFVKDTHGIVTQLIGHQDGQEFVAKKV